MLPVIFSYTSESISSSSRGMSGPLHWGTRYPKTGVKVMDQARLGKRRGTAFSMITSKGRAHNASKPGRRRSITRTWGQLCSLGESNWKSTPHTEYVYPSSDAPILNIESCVRLSSRNACSARPSPTFRTENTEAWNGISYPAM